jgi:DNA replication protein
MPASITGKDIRKQLKADLIGKDSYRGVTLTYSWLANQFGHIALGFIPTFILYLILAKYRGIQWAAFWSAVFISGAWLLFETYNFLGPLLSKNRSRSKVVFVPGKKYIFQPAWGNIAFDTGTDILFFWFGAFLTSILCYFSLTALIILLVIASLLIYPCCYWYPTKMYLQIPQYPFQFRLSQWDVEKIDADDMATVNKFLNNRNAGMHLLIFGSKNSGKTSIAVGIATELSIKHIPSVYITAMKLYCMFCDPDEKPETLWNWRTSSVLVIDDINPGYPIKEDITPPESFLKYIDTSLEENTPNRNVMKGLNIIWVLGNEDPQKILLGKWQAMLEKIGVDKKNIYSIDLLKTIPE